MSEKSGISLVWLSIIIVICLCSCDNKQTSSGTGSILPSTLAPELTDRSWLTGQPCRVPCWFGLTVGTSSMSTAREKVNELTFIDSNTVLVKGSTLTLHCKQPEQALCTHLFFENDRLIKIWMNVNFSISLQETVDNIGPPDFLSYKPIPPTKKAIRDCFLELFWIDRQMTIRYYDYGDNDMCNVIKEAGNKPKPDLPVQEVWYLLPEEFFDMNVDDGYYPWTGFAEDK